HMLAAPRELSALDALTPPMAESLIAGLRRNFALTVVDMPSSWTEWSNRILQLADRIILVSQLSVPHVHLIRHQFSVLPIPHLDQRPLTPVCNALSAEQQYLISIKSAEKAIGRAFDVVIPEDRRIMNTAINQGLEVSAVRRGTKLEKALSQLADVVQADVFAE